VLKYLILNPEIMFIFSLWSVYQNTQKISHCFLHKITPVLFYILFRLYYKFLSTSRHRRQTRQTPDRFDSFLRRTWLENQTRRYLSNQFDKFVRFYRM